MINKEYSKFSFIFTFVCLFTFFSQDVVWGQNFEQMRRIAEEKRKKLEKSESKILSQEGRLLIEWGGWQDIRFDEFNEDDNNATLNDALEATTSFDTRVWVQATLKPAVDDPTPRQHSIYLRLKNLGTVTSPSNLNKDFDNDGPHLDQGYAVLDLRPWGIEAGRRYFSVGQGIAYSNVHDGVEAYATFTDWNFKGFYSQTLPHEANIDLSVPGATKKSDRSFWGFEGRYIGISGHSIYGFFQKQRDDSDEKPVDNDREFTYDSEYIGLGLQGKILPEIHYWAELIKESGKSHVFTSGDKNAVDAWAGDFGLTYDWNVYSHPNFTLQYAFGTGDPDRVNVTDTQNGNTLGKDRNFLYFGYLPTGYALSPRLSNLHMIKAGVLLKPLENRDRFKSLTFGIDYYHFRKDEKTGGISDLDATVSNKDIGDEINLSLSWQILSDATLTFQYGYFFPGDAFPSATDDSETYFSTNLTLTF